MIRIRADVVASVKQWYRSPSAMFFTLAFPIILMLVFGALFSQGNGQLALAVQDNDHTAGSAQLLQGLNASGVLKLTSLEAGDVEQLAKDKDLSSVLVIPQGFGQAMGQGQAHITLLSDPSRTQSRTVQGVVHAVIDQVNLRASGAPPRVSMQDQEVRNSQGGGRYIDFFLPGVIGMTLSGNALIGGLEVSAKLKQRGILRKIATTPIRKWEWVLAKVVYQVFLTGLSAAVIILVGVVGFGVHIRADWTWPVLIALSGAMFAGIAMALSRVVKEEDQANAAGSAVNFPMIFLSGVFFPLESMPSFLQAIARVLPLTYVNEALRASMVTGNASALLLNGAAVALLALLAVAAGSLLVDWKEV
ncbi:MAG: ABC transporter permease [Halobacteriales archaeon]|nr:ABC transporter permease [Halobacteriales archaeon]